jgi:GT2 family glycosyltransferase
MIEIVSATRMTEGDFWQKAPLGLSMLRIASWDRRLVTRVAFENTTGLSSLFNSCIQADDSEDILVFMHDDIWIDDYFFADRILEGLDAFDVIGIAGNRRRVARQPAWAFPDETFKWDATEHLSGRLAHGDYPFGELSIFGAAPAECELLDGLLLAARKSTLRSREVQFDPRFDFHFYDMDFCRTARAKGLRLGTWPISVTHQSAGAFNSPAWREKLDLYRGKWGT